MDGMYGTSLFGYELTLCSYILSISYKVFPLILLNQKSIVILSLLLIPLSCGRVVQSSTHTQYSVWLTAIHKLLLYIYSVSVFFYFILWLLLPQTQSWRCPEVSLKSSSGFTLTNVRTHWQPYCLWLHHRGLQKRKFPTFCPGYLAANKHRETDGNP